MNSFTNIELISTDNTTVVNAGTYIAVGTRSNYGNLDTGPQYTSPYISVDNNASVSI